jgi:drug/metabolite transporter (DMT)-like permease
MCLTPLVAVVAAAVLLGERPRPLQAVGAALIIAGVVLTVRQRSDEGSSHPVPMNR